MAEPKKAKDYGKVKLLAIFIILFPMISLLISYFLYGSNLCFFVAMVAVLLGIIALLLVMSIVLLIFILRMRKKQEPKPTPLVDFLKDAESKDKSNVVDHIMQSMKYRKELEEEEKVDLRLLKFIDKARKLGLNYQEIKSRLLKYGWAHHEIEPTMSHHKVHGDKRLRSGKRR